MGENRPRNYRRLQTGIAQISLLVIGLLIIGWVYGSWFVAGFPYTHDGQIHLTRSMHYYLAIKEGQLPPRWAGGLNNGFGYPVFNFNYPLALLIGYPLIAIGIDVITSLKIIEVAMVVSGYVGMYLWLRIWFSRQASWLGALFYVLNPYIANVLFVRGSVGELSTFSLLPWVFYLLFKVVSSSIRTIWYTLGLIAVLTMFFISHNIMVMMGLPILIIYTIWLIKNDWWDNLKKLWAPILLAILLVGFFWVPALADKQATVLDQASLSTGYKDHFLYISQLFFGPGGFGFSYPGPVDSLNYSLSLASIMVFFLAIALSIKTKNRYLVCIILCFCFSLFLSIYLSQWLWQLIPITRYIQFPWRMLFWAQLGIVLLVTLTYRYLHQARLMWAIIVLILVLQTSYQSQSEQRIAPSNEDLRYATETTSTLDENMPKWFDKNRAYFLKDNWFGDQVVKGEVDGANVDVSLWTGSHHIYRANTQQPVRMVERTAYFPGWETRIDGRQVSIDHQQRDYPGLTTYVVSAGEHVIESRFTQNTWSRKLGNGLTLLGMVGVLGLIGWSIANHYVIRAEKIGH